MAFAVDSYVTPLRLLMKRGFSSMVDSPQNLIQSSELVDWNGRRTTIGRIVSVGASEVRSTTEWRPDTSADAVVTLAAATIYTVAVWDIDAGAHLLNLEYPETTLVAYSGPGEASGLHYDSSKITDIAEAEKAIAS